MKHERESPDDRTWLFYDGACGFCSRWVPFWSGTLARRGITIATLQSDSARERLGLPDRELLDDLRLWLASGEQIRGPDVYRYVMRRVWWAYPLFVLSITPGLRSVFDWAYRKFAIHRYRISAACRLPDDRS